MPGPQTGPKTTKKTRVSEYGKRLQEKQAAKREYGLREKQFRRYFDMARKVREATGAKLLELLERRLDNVIYRLDLTQTRRQARQLVSHGHVLLNGKKVNVPSVQVHIGDVVELRTSKLTSPRGVDTPAWLKPNADKNGGQVSALPAREDITAEVDEQLIVEFYSR